MGQIAKDTYVNETSGDVRFSSAGPSSSLLSLPFLSRGHSEQEGLYILETLSPPVVPCLETDSLCISQSALLNESKQGFFSWLSLGKGATTVNTAFLPGLFRVWGRLRSHNALLQSLWLIGPWNTGLSPEAGPVLEK